MLKSRVLTKRIFHEVCWAETALMRKGIGACETFRTRSGIPYCARAVILIPHRNAVLYTCLEKKYLPCLFGRNCTDAKMNWCETFRSRSDIPDCARAVILIPHRNAVFVQVHFTTVEPQWLEHLWNHGNLFQIWVVRATEG